MKPTNFSQWVTTKSLEALQCFNRAIVVLQGEGDWTNMLLKQLESYPYPESSIKTDTSSWYVYSDKPSIKGNVNKQTFRNALGTESQFVVFYSDNLNIDALAALSGTLVSGGVLFLVLPTHIKSSTFFKESFFNQRLVARVLSNSTVNIIKQTSVKDLTELRVSNYSEGKDVVIPNNHPIHKNKPFDMGCVTQEQLTAVKHVIQVVKGHRNRPLVLTADRGRGKSSALAIACAELIINSQTTINIAITTAHRKSLDVFFTQLLISLNIEGSPDTSLELLNNKLEFKHSTVEFIPADELINNTSTFHLVIVDEAASIALPQLSQLLDKYHRLVFASTVHGYEGAGRSFTLKFQKQVALKYPEYKALHITQPIRWADGDPLETFIDDLCLLKAEVPALLGHSSALNEKEVKFTEISSETLINNELLLQQVFAILVTAHYQTSPNDLRLMIDNQNITLVTLTYEQYVLGVALLLDEGVSSIVRAGISKEEVKTLLQSNKRRLKDQFIPQSLLTHCGEENSFDYSYLRVMRIAILPELQGKGLGRIFLSHIDEYAKQKSIDFVGTSFGANKQLLNFWQKSGYKTARIGFTKDKSSGEHSALLLKVINTHHTKFIEEVESNFYQSFDYLLGEQYRELNPELVWQVLTHCPQSLLPKLNAADLKAVEDFYTRKRQYSICVYHLHKWLLHQMQRPFDVGMEPTINKIFQRKSIKEITKIYDFAGKKAFNNYLINFVQHYSENKVTY